MRARIPRRVPTLAPQFHLHPLPQSPRTALPRRKPLTCPQTAAESPPDSRIRPHTSAVPIECGRVREMRRFVVSGANLKRLTLSVAISPVRGANVGARRMSEALLLMERKRLCPQLRFGLRASKPKKISPVQIEKDRDVFLGGELLSNMAADAKAADHSDGWGGLSAE